MTMAAEEIVHTDTMGRGARFRGNLILAEPTSEGQTGCLGS